LPAGLCRRSQLCFLISPVGVSQAGNYRVVVSCPCGSVTSPEAKLTVTAPIPRMVFEAQNRASGVQWGPGFSNPNDEEWSFDDLDL
jgi:hypothetical protein